VSGHLSVIGDGREDELLWATTGLQEEVLGPWHQSVYEQGRHVSVRIGPAYVRFRPIVLKKSDGNIFGSLSEALILRPIDDRSLWLVLDSRVTNLCGPPGI